MKKWAYSVAALVLMAGLAVFAPGLMHGESGRTAEKELIVVWMNKADGDAGAWLKKAAAAFEKKTGKRVYLRYASQEERERLQNRGEIFPDVVTGGEKGAVLAMCGWALIVPDASNVSVTPAPSPALFIRPTAVPQNDAPSSTPVPLSVKNVAVPPEMTGRISGAYVSENPLSDVLNGKADGALLSPRQAAQMKNGYTWSVGGEYFLPIRGEAYTDNGQQFLAFLRSMEGQRLLVSQRLFSWDASCYLYGAENSLLFQMDRCR